ncbi:MAG: threonine transporter RhtB [Rhizobiales bacterium]|nr:threonine transporter RhtB [Hyphomicrobiales bacterium]MBA69875.1 threonine transporter RhtB [Hyphomicrobiales bacterium]|tara:strand:+ start:1194 stop:1838 length:645 start_codon:yes stop_codon:yes gene_type:complete
MSYIPDTPTLLAFIAAWFVIGITPGPDMTLQIARVMTSGRAAGLACGFGAVAGLAVHTLLVALGISALVVAAPLAFLVLKICGALYLLWLAFQAIRHGSTFDLRPEKTGRERSLFSHFMQGVAVNLLNPKIVLFFMTFLPQFVRAGDPDITGKLLFLGGLFTVLSIPLMTSIVLGAHQLTNWLKARPLVTRAIDWLFAGVFSLFAVRILLVQSR